MGIPVCSRQNCSIIVQQICDKIWPNRAFCDKSAKFSGNVGFNPLNEIDYGPIM